MVKRQIIVGTHSTELDRKCGIATHHHSLTQNFFGLKRFGGLRINALIDAKQKFREERLPHIWRKTNQKDVLGRQIKRNISDFRSNNR